MNKQFYTSIKDEIKKDGHTMFTMDVVSDLNRKHFLEGEIIRLNELLIAKRQTFDSWAFEQVVKKGFDIDSVQNDEGVNIKWVNRQNGDEYILDKE